MWFAQNFTWFHQLRAEYVWAVEAIVIIGLTLVCVYLEGLIYRRLKPKLVSKERHWELAILQAVHKPLSFFLWVVGISFFFDIVAAYSTEKALIFEIVPILRKILLIFVLLWFSLTFIKQIEILLMTPTEEGHYLDKTTIRAIGQVLRVVVIVSSVFILLQITFGVGASGVIAFAGGGGITIGWAAKDMIANFFGGLMIFLDRPFVIGDRIKCHDKSFEGFVEHIGWRLTCIRNLEKVPLYIPNSLFLTETIENPSRMSHRKVKTQIGVRYEDVDKVTLIAKDISKMIKDHHEIDPTEKVIVSLAQFSPSSLDFSISAYTRNIDEEEFLRTQQDILIKIIQIIKSHKAECAYPTTVMHLPNEIRFAGLNKELTELNKE